MIIKFDEKSKFIKKMKKLSSEMKGRIEADQTRKKSLKKLKQVNKKKNSLKVKIKIF